MIVNITLFNPYQYLIYIFKERDFLHYICPSLQNHSFAKTSIPQCLRGPTIINYELEAIDGVDMHEKVVRAPYNWNEDYHHWFAPNRIKSIRPQNSTRISREFKITKMVGNGGATASP